LIATEFPGQFPDEKLYNLDYRDEERWVIEARKKQLRRDISALYLTAIAFSGSEEVNNKLIEMQNDLRRLEGVKEETLEGGASPAWEWLKAKKRG